MVPIYLNAQPYRKQVLIYITHSDTWVRKQVLIHTSNTWIYKWYNNLAMLSHIEKKVMIIHDNS